VRAKLAAHPDAELLVHPECGCTTSVLWLTSTGDVPAKRTRVLSTGGMVKAAAVTDASEVLVATETGIIHQLEKVNGRRTRFIAMNERATCRFMKMITPEKLLRSLRDGVDEVTVPKDIADLARASVERMIAIGQPSRGGE
jgi:quinolinate synthase